jgi:glycine dehydrogenase subunit 2
MTKRNDTGLIQEEPLLFEHGRRGRRAYSLPHWDVDAVAPEAVFPTGLARKDLEGLPELSEVDVVRHFTRLSQWNYGVDSGLYPLGSCTMKYNPKVNEELARTPALALLHPDAPVALVQGMLALLFAFSREVLTIVGMDALSLHPAAGAHGELLGMKLVRGYHRARGSSKHTVLIPDSAHGTNPASVALTGLTPRQIPSRADGRIDMPALAAAINADTAAIMITNPNTLGIFETEIEEIAARVHAVDGLVYMDGANLNALIGLARPGDMGVDIAHLNLHKTFSTPHGGGGPGSGPVAVMSKLEPFLPVPQLEARGEGFVLNEGRPQSIGRLHPYGGNVGVILRAHAYIRSLGGSGLADVSRAALVNANYLKQMVADDFPAAMPGPCMHEFVVSGAWTRKHDVRNIDVAKRLLDYGFHAPTVSFPLIVPDALMIEPTETETRRTLDAFAGALRAIAAEVREHPQVVRAAPTCTCVGRLDEAEAARSLKVRWTPPAGAAENAG